MATEPKNAEVLEARIQHALAPYVGRLTPEALAEARRLLTVTLTTHPVLAPLVERLQEQGPAAAGASGVVARDGGPELGELLEVKRRGVRKG